MADISAEIAAFQNAVYGEDVRSAMISLANKVNNESSSSGTIAGNYDQYLSKLGLTVITGQGKYVDYDTYTQLITIPGDTVLISKNGKGFTSKPTGGNPITIDTSVITSGAKKIVVRISDLDFKVIAYTSSIPNDYLYFASLRTTDDYGTTIVADFPWSVNGVPYNLEEKTIVRKGFTLTNGGFSAQNAYKEVYSQLYTCSNGSVFNIHIKYTTAQYIWLAAGLYDQNLNFIRRHDFLSTSVRIGEINRSYKVTTVDAAYVIFMTRLYDDGIMNISTKELDTGIDIFNNYAITNNYTVLIGGSTRDSYINYDSTNKTLTIPQDTLLVPKGTIISDLIKINNENYFRLSPATSSVTIDIYGESSAPDSGALIWLYNPFTNKHVFRSYRNQSGTPESNLIYIATLRIRNVENAIIADFPWSIDGKPYGLNLLDAGVKISMIAEQTGNAVASVNHRGYSTVAPENTLPAYKLSKKNGFLRVETDVSFTSDNIPVLLHDSTINRTARNSDGTELSSTINIKDITYNDLLQYDFGIWKSSTYAGTSIPKFEDFIILCRNLGLHPYIEMKSSDTYTESQIRSLVDIVRKNGMKNKVSWISFSNIFLGYVKNYDSYARLGYVVVTVSETVITNALALKTANNEVFVDASDYSENAVTLCYNADLPLEVWTINSAATIKNLPAYVSGVTSDNQIAADILYNDNID